MDGAYASGNYSLSVNFSGFGTLEGSVNLPAVNYPPVPTISNITPLQSFDAAGMGTINWNAFAGAGPDDAVQIVIRRQDNSLVETSGRLPAGDTTYAPGSLEAGTVYNASITFIRVAAQDNASLLAQSSQFATETRFRIQTSGGGGGADTTPPQLLLASPTNGSTGVVLILPVAFRFSEPMDQTKISVSWNGLDAAKFSSRWLDSETLSCTYTGAAPTTATLVTWTLNATPAGPNNIRDVAGNPLPQTTGTFTTAGSPSSGNCTNQSTLDKAGFGFFKSTNHRQSDAGAPVEDGTLGAMFQAFNTVTNPVNRAALSFGGPPAVLQFLSAAGGMQILGRPFADQSAMDGVFPPGTYAFQLREPTNVVIAAVNLVLPASSYPNVPHFANYSAAQNIDTNLDFTLSWDAFSGATTNDSLQIEIKDQNDTTILSLPDHCSGPGLPATSTSVVLPRGLLPGGQNLTAILTFNKANDTGKNMPGTAALGVVASSRTTRMGIRTTGGVPPGPVRFLNIVKLSPNVISMSATGSVGRAYVIESSATVNGGWTSLATHTADQFGTITVVVDPTVLPPRRFFRAVGR